MRTVLDARTSSGYATRSRRGVHSVLDIETALAATNTAARLRDRVAAARIPEPTTTASKAAVPTASAADRRPT